MTDEPSLVERLAGYLYPVPEQHRRAPDAPPPLLRDEEPTRPPSPSPTVVAPRRQEVADPTVVLARPPVPARWEWEERNGMRTAAFLASVTLLLGAGVAGVILYRSANEPVGPAGLGVGIERSPGLLAELPATEVVPPATTPAGPAAVLPSIQPVVVQAETTTTTTRRTATTQPKVQSGTTGPPVTLNPPHRPVTPTRPAYSTTTTRRAPSSTTTSTTEPPATTTTTSKPKRD